MEINKTTLRDFAKLLIELGGMYELQENNTITETDTGTLCAVKVGTKPLPIMLMYEGMPAGEYAILNPFKENHGVSREREWLFNVFSATLGFLTKKLMCTITKDCVEKRDDNYAQMPLMRLIRDKADETMIDELEKLPAGAFLSVFYNKKEKFAVAQTELFSEELHAAFPKFRKKTWEVIGILFEEFFGKRDLSDDFKFVSKIINIPETDAKLHAVIHLVKALGPLTRDIRGVDLHENELLYHLDFLEGYARLYSWAAIAAERSDKFPPVASWAAGPGQPPPAMRSILGGATAPQPVPIMGQQQSYGIAGMVPITNSLAMAVPQPVYAYGSTAMLPPQYNPYLLQPEPMGLRPPQAQIPLNRFSAI